ncbi:MAG TPA: VWA domain-containing protein [Chloroflexota bacterium]|nr:VWA domain-containing protein [Chloroflexota bacterium]
MNFQFATPWFLTLLIIIPALALWHWRNRAAKPAAMQYAVAGLTKGLPGSWRITARPLLTLTRLLAMAMLIMGLARPQLGHAREIIKGEGVEIALALDISGSMASLDFEPENRLEASKRVISQFIGERPYDKLGLVIFSNEAYAQSPLTLDHAMLQRSLDQVELATDLGLEDGTAIGLGLANAANMLTSSDANSKVVVLLTDGVNNAGQIDPLTAAEAAKTLGIKVYTIGAGRPGQVPVPVDTIFGTQISYQESQIDEDTLRQVADITGGQYFRAEDSNALAQIYDQINELEKSQVEIQVYNQYQELMIWLVLPAALLFVAEMLLRKTAFRTIP